MSPLDGAFATGGSFVYTGGVGSPAALRRRAKQIEKTRKREKRAQRERDARRHVAIEALKSVAADLNAPGHERITAARELLKVDA